MSLPGEELLSAATLRNLGDRSYEKRKQAALDVEQCVREKNKANDTDAINKIIRLHKKDFIESAQPNHRKGGLIGLAAIAIGLMGVGFICYFRISFDFPPLTGCLLVP